MRKNGDNNSQKQTKQKPARKGKKEAPSLKQKLREERKNRRAKRPKMKARWIGEGDGRRLVGRNEAGTKKGKGQQR